ncbi:MAG: ABC transporter permease [Firmicutes bacterium]|nr:ABC transporter permease [Bacillota bacterium]
MLFVTAITFFLVNLAPGGPAVMMRMDATAEQRQVWISRLNLDMPVHLRYLHWLKDAVRGDLGRSVNDNREVTGLIAQRLPNTMLLSVTALAISVVVGIPMGILSAIRRNSIWDYAFSVISVAGLSVPAFWFAIMLILLFSVTLNWLPSSGVATVGMGFSLTDRLRHLIMPVIVLSTTALPFIVRFTRSAMLGILQEDYVRTARAKGLGERTVYYSHALKNALIPVITQIGLLIARLVGGAVITESVFGWPGMGRLAVEASHARDFTVIMGVTVVIAAVVVIINILVDLAYTWVDPRIRYG